MRYLFIISNTIRTKELQKLEDVISSLGEEQRNSIELRYVQYQGHAMDLATEASDQYDDKVTVVAVGGDKIVHEIVNALAYRSTPLIILPMGTYNDFAGSVYPEYVMKNPAAMVKRLAEVKFSPIDLVRLDSYDVLGNHLPVWSGFFINVATIGFDTQLTNTGTDLAAKKGKDYNASKACVKGLRSATQKLRPYKLDYNFELVDSAAVRMENGVKVSLPCEGSAVFAAAYDENGNALWARNLYVQLYYYAGGGDSFVFRAKQQKAEGKYTYEDPHQIMQCPRHPDFTF